MINDIDLWTHNITPIIALVEKRIDMSPLPNFFTEFTKLAAVSIKHILKIYNICSEKIKKILVFFKKFKFA